MNISNINGEEFQVKDWSEEVDKVTAFKTEKISYEDFKITIEVLNKVSKLAAQGMSKPQIANVLFINMKTYNKLQEDNSDFGDAYFQGVTSGIQVATEKLFERVVAGDFKSVKFYLEKRDADNWGEGGELTTEMGPLEEPIMGDSDAETLDSFFEQLQNPS